MSTRKTAVVLLSCSLIVLINVAVILARDEDGSAVSAVYVEGACSVRSAGEARWRPLVADATLCVGDEIETAEDARVELTIPEMGLVRIAPLSHVVIKGLTTVEVTKVPTETWAVLKGKIRAVISPVVRREPAFLIETENAVVGVRGTDFGVQYSVDTPTTTVIVMEGSVNFNSKQYPETKTMIVHTGEGLSVSLGTPPGQPHEVGPEEIRLFMEDMEIRSTGNSPSRGGWDQDSNPFFDGCLPGTDTMEPPPFGGIDAGGAPGIHEDCF